MKFTNYLENIILNEIFNITTENKILTKVTFSDARIFALVILNQLNNENLFNISELLKKNENISDLLKENENVLINIIKKQRQQQKKLFESYQRLSPKNILSNIDKELCDIYTRKENYYIKEASGGILFFVDEKLYKLELLSISNVISIIFDEFGGEYKINSVMASQKTGSELFNKIFLIIKQEETNWETKVFSFNPKLIGGDNPDNRKQTNEEKNVENLINILQEIDKLKLLSKYFLNKNITTNEITPIQNKLNNLNKNIKKKLQEDIEDHLLTYLPNNKNDLYNFINFIFSNTNTLQKIKIENKNLKPALKNIENNWDNISKYVATQVYSYNSVRSRLYRIIIQQTWGKKVIIKPKGRNVYFSLDEKEIEKAINTHNDSGTRYK